MEKVLDKPTTTSTATAAGAKAGVYRLPQLQVSRENFPGSPTLTLNLLVNTVDSDVMGSGEISQALAPPGGSRPIPSISGKIGQIGDRRLIHLQGTYGIPFGPTQPGQIDARMTAALVIDKDGNGWGLFNFGPNAEHSLVDCRVTAKS